MFRIRNNISYKEQDVRWNKKKNARKKIFVVKIWAFNTKERILDSASF